MVPGAGPSCLAADLDFFDFCRFDVGAGAGAGVDGSVGLGVGVVMEVVVVGLSSRDEALRFFSFFVGVVGGIVEVVVGVVVVDVVVVAGVGKTGVDVEEEALSWDFSAFAC